MKENTEIDLIDWEIVELLQQDGRMPVAQLARKLRMSPPSVADRIQCLETAGVIRIPGASPALKICWPSQSPIRVLFACC